MNYGDLQTQVYRILEDPNGFAWPNSAVAFNLNTAVSTLVNKLGRAEGRLTLSTVVGQQEYTLPQGITRVKQVRILPQIQAGGSQQEPSGSLTELALEDMPVVVTQNGNPDRFSLKAVGGSNEDQFSIFVWTAPDWAASDNIIVDFDIDYQFTSDDPSSGADLAQLIPFPPAYDKIIVRLTAAEMLGERSDADDIQKGEFWYDKAMQELKPKLPIRTTSYRRDVRRAFP